MPAEALIAFIDDDASFSEAMTEALELLGYKVRSFASAENFLAEGQVQAYACIVTDIQMPGMSGFDLKQALSERHIQVPVIMMTGHFQSWIASRGAFLGAVCLLEKPFEIEVLAAWLERVQASKNDGNDGA